MSRGDRSRWQVCVCAAMAILVFASLAVAQVIVIPKIKGRLVDVVVRDGSIQMPAVLEKGWVTFRVINGGRELHSFAATGRGKTYALPVALPPGTAGLLPIKLKEGVYTISCQIENHAGHGEQVAVTVVDD